MFVLRLYIYIYIYLIYTYYICIDLKKYMIYDKIHEKMYKAVTDVRGIRHMIND